MNFYEALKTGTLAFTLAVAAIGCAAPVEPPTEPARATVPVPPARDGGADADWRSCPHATADGSPSGNCDDPALYEPYQPDAADAGPCPEGFVCLPVLDAGLVEKGPEPRTPES